MKRIVVKIGSSSLVDENGLISQVKMERLVNQLSQLHQANFQLILVSSGAVATGLSSLGWKRSRMTMPEKQAAAAVGQSLLIQQYQALFRQRQIPIAQLLLTRADMEDRKRFIHIRNTMEPLLRNRIIPIINENDTVTVEVIRFGDNDTLGALVSLVAGADTYIMLTDTDGLYTANPKVDKDAKLITKITKISPEIMGLAGGNGSEVGTGGMQTKLQAAAIATQSGTEVIIANSSTPNVLQRLLHDESIGTHFLANSPSWKKKKSWLAFGSKSEGKVTIDLGAYVAITEGKSSLLLAGVYSVTGQFLEGAVVDLFYENSPIGKGIIHFSSWDMQHLLNQKQQGECLTKLPEVIHRDHLVLLTKEKRSVRT